MLDEHNLLKAAQRAKDPPAEESPCCTLGSFRKQRYLISGPFTRGSLRVLYWGTPLPKVKSQCITCVALRRSLLVTADCCARCVCGPRGYVLTEWSTACIERVQNLLTLVV